MIFQNKIVQEIPAMKHTEPAIFFLHFQYTRTQTQKIVLKIEVEMK